MQGAVLEGRGGSGFENQEVVEEGAGKKGRNSGRRVDGQGAGWKGTVR
jgi:hypothetical protein